jgi:hypothetical protein
MNGMYFMGMKTIEGVGKLMGLNEDYVNYGKMYIPGIYMEGFSCIWFL